MYKLIAVLLASLVLVSCGSSTSSQRATPTSMGISGVVKNTPTIQTIEKTPEATKEITATDEPEPPPEPTGSEIGKIGDRQVVDGVALTVVGVERTKQPDVISTAKEGMTYLIVEVVLENVDRDEMSYNQLYFSIKDAEGFKIDATFTGNPEEPNIKTGDLGKGEKARGFVPFEVKEDATGLVLSYEPIAIISDVQPIKVALDQ